MDPQPILTIIATIGAGVCALVLAEKTKLPSILYLLVFGVLLGPSFANVIQPRIFQANFKIYIELMVAVILFEGGASLQFAQFRKISNVLKKLLSIGVVTTLIGVALATHFFSHLNWSKSILFGALMIVTGPTVVVPILRRVRLKENLHNILKWEAILIDPLGVVVAAVLFEFLIPQDSIWVREFFGFFLRLASGIAIGILTGWLIEQGLKRESFFRAEGEELGGLFVLAMNLFSFGASELLIPHSGLVAATTTGIYFGNRKYALKDQILHFKRQITLVALAVLFILLSSNVSFRFVRTIMWEGTWILAVLILVIRPLSVFLSTFRDKSLTAPEKIYLASLAPRGIVSASLASLFAISSEARALTASGYFLPLAFYVIAGTIVFYTFISSFAARFLGVREQPTGIAIVGANPTGFLIAEELRKRRIQVVLIDNSAQACALAKKNKFTCYMGSGFDSDFLISLDLKGIEKMLAVTVNHEVNVLSCQAFARFLGRNYVYRLWDKTDEWKTASSDEYDPSWGRPFLVHVDRPNERVDDQIGRKTIIKTVVVEEPIVLDETKTLSKFLPFIPIGAVASGYFIPMSPHARVPQGAELILLGPEGEKTA